MSRTTKTILAILAGVGLAASVGVVVKAQLQGIPSGIESLTDRLDRRVTPGSALDTIPRVNQNRPPADRIRGDRNDNTLAIERFAVRMPGNTDAEDRAPLPSWFRAYLRANFPLLPRRGG